jgi:prephenate dehydratase
MRAFTLLKAVLFTWSLAGAATAGAIGYLGPAGSWSHQACADLFGQADLAPLPQAALFADYRTGKIDKACVPVTAASAGVTPYLDEVLDLPDVRIVAEYPKPLSYSLLANPGATLAGVTEVVAHPVALTTVEPWLDANLPKAARTPSASNGAAAQSVAAGKALNQASLGPWIGAQIYGLTSLVDGIEEGPQNVTRWWVLGRETPAPTGNDKTSLLIDSSDARLAEVLKAFDRAGVQILDIYERPSKRSLDTHRYLVEVAGHAKVGALAAFLAAHREVRLLGSYPRKY